MAFWRDLWYIRERRLPVHAPLVVVLFFLAVGISAAGLLKLISRGSVSRLAAILWTVALAVCWTAWYVMIR